MGDKSIDLVTHFALMSHFWVKINQVQSLHELIVLNWYHCRNLQQQQVFSSPVMGRLGSLLCVTSYQSDRGWILLSSSVSPLKKLNNVEYWTVRVICLLLSSFNHARIYVTILWLTCRLDKNMSSNEKQLFVIVHNSLYSWDHCQHPPVKLCRWCDWCHEAWDVIERGC